jgi:Spy/CpxP family protein refolding chaperone
MIGTSLVDRVTVRRLWNPRAVAAITLSLVFLCGAAAGALVMDLRIHDRLRPPVLDTATGKALYFERLQKELDLTPAQSEQIQSILNDFWQYYRSVMSDSKQRVEQILTDEQRKKFARFLQQQLPR